MVISPLILEKNKFKLLEIMTVQKFILGVGRRGETKQLLKKNNNLACIILHIISRYRFACITSHTAPQSVPIWLFFFPSFLIASELLIDYTNQSRKRRTSRGELSSTYSGDRKKKWQIHLQNTVCRITYICVYINPCILADNLPGK